MTSPVVIAHRPRRAASDGRRGAIGQRCMGGRCWNECRIVNPDTWAEKYECFERINSIRKTSGNFDSCNSCKRRGTDRSHELHESKFPLFHTTNLSARNFRIFLLMYQGSATNEASTESLARDRERGRRWLVWVKRDGGRWLVVNGCVLSRSVSDSVGRSRSAYGRRGAGVAVRPLRPAANLLSGGSWPTLKLSGFGPIEFLPLGTPAVSGRTESTREP